MFVVEVNLAEFILEISFFAFDDELLQQTGLRQYAHQYPPAIQYQAATRGGDTECQVDRVSTVTINTLLDNLRRGLPGFDVSFCLQKMKQARQSD